MALKRRQRVRRSIIFLVFLSFPAIFFYFSPALIVMGAIEGIAVGRGKFRVRIMKKQESTHIIEKITVGCMCS